MLERDPEGVHGAVECDDVDLTVARRRRDASDERGDRRAARPQLFARRRVQRVEHRRLGTLHPLRGDLRVGAPILAARDRKDDAVDDGRRRRRHHVARSPCGLECRRSSLIDQLEGGDRAGGDGAVGRRKGNGTVGPERAGRREDPPRAVRPLRRRQRAGRKVGGRRIRCARGQRRSMVGAAERRGIQHVQPTIGVRRHDQVLALVLKCDGRCRESGLPRRKPVLRLQREPIERDHGVGVVRAGRGAAVGGHEHVAVGAERRSGAANDVRAVGFPLRHLLRVAGKVEGIDAIRGRTAAVARRDIQDRVNQYGADRLGIRRQQLDRRREVVAGLRIERVQLAAARNGVDVRIAATRPRWRGGGRGRRRHRGAKRRRTRNRGHRARARQASRRGRQRVQMPLPEHLVEVVVDRIHVVGAAADEGEGLEPLVRNDVRQQHRLG